MEKTIELYEKFSSRGAGALVGGIAMNMDAADAKSTKMSDADRAGSSAVTTETARRFDLGRISEALGPTPPVSYAAAHAYPAAAPSFLSRPLAERPSCPEDNLRVYIHIPFCNYSCSFCFFAIRVGQRREQMEAYVAAVKKELDWIAPGTPLSQLFMGGGTPTTLPADLLDDLLTHVFSRTDRAKEQVHTVEASPDSLTVDHIDVLRRHGIGRISMGIQSLNEDVLERIRRQHSPIKALGACELLVDSGFIVNVDLMYGLPGQSEASFREDFEKVAGQGVQALTVYDLRLNERTPVGRDLDEQEQLELQRIIRWRQFVKGVADDCGFVQTRWHTFKRMDTIASRHERAAHHKGDGQGYQFGAGMSARSHLGLSVYRNHANINAYIERVEAGQSPVEEVFPLETEDRKTQFIGRSLGDGKPLEYAAYASSFGATIEQDFGPVLDRLRQGDLIADDGDSIVLTDLGRLVYDRITYNFYPPRALKWLSERSHPTPVGAAN